MTPFAPFLRERIAVVGLGRAGLPAALRLRDWGAHVTCWDDRPEARTAAAAAGLPLAERFDADALLLSPGIPDSHPAARAAHAAGAPILCDAEYLQRAVLAAGSRARFVGITGTNGKSTTTALLAHVLRAAGRTVAEGGNLGPAALSLPVLPDDGVYVLEMSSYMLARLARLRFHAAAMLNLSPDHLDWHGGMAAYAGAKARIFARQRPGDTAVLGPAIDVPTNAGVARVRLGPPDPILQDEHGPIVDLGHARALPGLHNAENAGAAVALARALGVPRDAWAGALLSFPGLPHRQELIAEIAGTRWISDSKATNADSAARALAVHERVVWIAGGVAKAGGIASLAPHFPRIAHALLIGDAAPEFAATLAAAQVPHTITHALEAAVAHAARLSPPVVLLAPAAASFDQFSGFEARGERFRALVHALRQQAA